MGIDDLVNKGKDLYAKNKDRIDEALHSEHAEKISDRVLDGASNIAKKILPDSADDKIDQTRDSIDRRIGDDGDGDQARHDPPAGDGGR